jgi:hypothetical protein
MKVVCFVLFIILNLPNRNTSCCVLHTFKKAFDEQGCINWFHNVATYGGKVIEY